MRTREEYNNLSDLAVRFLEDKYNREFRLKSYEMGDYLSNIDYVRCTTQGLDSENECIIVTVKEDEGQIVFADNYFAYLIRPELESYIRDIVKKEFQDIKVYVANEDVFFQNELTDKSSLDDMYREESDYRASIKVYVKGDSEISQADYEEKMKSIENQLIESGHSYIIYLFVLNPMVYDTISRYEQEEFWEFYIENRVPDNEHYYYLYYNRIDGGQ